MDFVDLFTTEQIKKVNKICPLFSRMKLGSAIKEGVEARAGTLALNSVDLEELNTLVKDYIDASGGPTPTFDTVYDSEPGVIRAVTLDDGYLDFLIPINLGTGDISDQGIRIWINANDDNFEEASNSRTIFSTFYWWNKDTDNIKRGIFHKIQDGYAQLEVGIEGQNRVVITGTMMEMPSETDRFFSIGEETFFAGVVDFHDDIKIAGDNFTAGVLYSGSVDTPSDAVKISTDGISFGSGLDQWFNFSDESSIGNLIISEDGSSFSNALTADHLQLNWDSGIIANFQGSETSQNTFRIGMKYQVGSQAFLNLGTGNKTVMGWRKNTGNLFQGMWTDYDNASLIITNGVKSIVIGSILNTEDLYIANGIASEGGTIEGFNIKMTEYNFEFGTGVGAMFGTAANQKWATHGATPVIQATHIIDAPGDTAANNATTINAILVALENKGFLASS